MDTKVLDKYVKTQIKDSYPTKHTTKIKKLHPNAVLPQYAKTDDAGADLVATEVEASPFSDEVVIKTGIAIEMPIGYVGLVFPRSSISKTGLSLKNSIGVIDNGYRGEIILKFRQHGSLTNLYKVGDRVAQLMIIPFQQHTFEEVNELSETERGSGGFGSSGS